jgi:hypothetical protein
VLLAPGKEIGEFGKVGEIADLRDIGGVSTAAHEVAVCVGLHIILKCTETFNQLRVGGQIRHVGTLHCVI